MIRTGLENLLQSPPAWLENSRLGLLCNPASVNARLQPAAKMIAMRFPGRLKALFTPQHGFHAAKQDNMIESADIMDPMLSIPVFSLYSHTRVPTPQMMENVDVLLVDIQDVGTRVYTFIYTMSYCMEAFGAAGKKVVVLDRPNPIGGLAVEGNILDTSCSSFVGRFPIPMRHGMTMAEMALFFQKQCNISCDLSVIPLTGWKRSMLYGQTGLFWIPPSPNLPSPVSALVYPGQVIWEGSNVSEGRGTTLPFEMFGAPFVDTRAVLDVMGGEEVPGAILRPCAFEPVAGKWQGNLCNGFQIHVTDPVAFAPYLTSLRLLQAVIKCHPKDFAYKQPPYEYEFERLPMDLILGDTVLRHNVENMEDLFAVERSWQTGLKEYLKARAPVLLYS